MHLLYFWRGDNYAGDIAGGLAYHLNSAVPHFHEIGLGESLWAFTRRPDGAYVLAAELVVSAKSHNPANYKYGTYRVWGDRRRSRYFRTDTSPEAETTIRALSVRPRTEVLGRSFQGPGAIRRLTDADHQLLRAFSGPLPLLVEPDALLSEEALEMAIQVGDTDLVERLVFQAPLLSAERRAYLVRAYQRNRSLLEELRSCYRGRCQICEWDPLALYGVHLCEGHHLHWLSRGGEDELGNLALLCPDHHRAVHTLDVPLDYDVMGFRFGARVERLSLNEHLK